MIILINDSSHKWFLGLFFSIWCLSFKRCWMVFAKTLTPVLASNLTGSCCLVWVPDLGLLMIHCTSVVSVHYNLFSISAWYKVFCSRIAHVEFFPNYVCANTSFKHARNLMIPTKFALISSLGANVFKPLLAISL